MSRKYFGTDGIRGRVGESPITPDFVMRLSHAAGKVLARSGASGAGRPTVLIGKDTRISGYMLEAALEAGFAAAGVDVAADVRKMRALMDRERRPHGFWDLKLSPGGQVDAEFASLNLKQINHQTLHNLNHVAGDFSTAVHALQERIKNKA